jgi:hypothetical protein
VGQPLTIYDVNKIGIWQLEDSAKGAIASNLPIQYPGQVRIQDLNGDGKIDQNDRQLLAISSQNGRGITNRFSYKGLIFHCNLCRMGMKVLVPI